MPNNHKNITFVGLECLLKVSLISISKGFQKIANIIKPIILPVIHHDETVPKSKLAKDMVHFCSAFWGIRTLRVTIGNNKQEYHPMLIKTQSMQPTRTPINTNQPTC